MSNYRQLHSRMWSSDNWFIDLKPEFKLLFIYLFSNERASICGLYELPLQIISFETRLDIETISHGLEIFTKADKVKYDFESGVVWVKNMLKYQGSSSPKIQARIKADIKSVPDCVLKSEALKSLSDTVSIPYADGIDTLLSVSVSNSVSISDSEEGGVGEGEIFAAYQDNIVMLTPKIADGIKADIDDYSVEWVMAAIDYAVKQEKRSLAYMEGTLKGWKQDGLSNPPTNKPDAKERSNGNHANTRTGNQKGTKRTRTRVPEYSQADLDTAAEINAAVPRMP